VLRQLMLVVVSTQLPSCVAETPASPCVFASCRELCAAAATGPGLADMFGRIMVSVDEDIISLEIPRCAPTCLLFFQTDGNPVEDAGVLQGTASSCMRESPQAHVPCMHAAALHAEYC
jgi:hypothetical protein